MKIYFYNTIEWETIGEDIVFGASALFIKCYLPIYPLKKHINNEIKAIYSLLLFKIRTHEHLLKNQI